MHSSLTDFSSLQTQHGLGFLTGKSVLVGAVENRGEQPHTIAVVLGVHSRSRFGSKESEKRHLLVMY